MIDIEVLRSKLIKCFGASPVSCDGQLSVSVDDYNELIKYINDATGSYAILLRNDLLANFQEWVLRANCASALGEDDSPDFEKALVSLDALREVESTLPVEMRVFHE